MVPKTNALSSRSRRQAEVLGRQASRTCRLSSGTWRLECDRRLAAICRRHNASRGFEPRSLDSESRVLTVTPRGQLHELPVMLSWLLLLLLLLMLPSPPSTSQVGLLVPSWKPEDQILSLVHRVAYAKTPKRNSFRNHHLWIGMASCPGEQSSMNG